MIICVTGGIGSGKSTVSKTLAVLGAKTIDADVIARQVIGKGQKAHIEILSHFGDEVLDENGEIDRKKLAGIVFNNPKELSILNTITHKYVNEEIISLIEMYKTENDSDLIVVDVPIPFEQEFIKLVDEIWVVAADRDTRIRRIMVRNGFDYEEAVSRINSQKKDEDYFNIADEILYNNGDMEELKNNILCLVKNKN